MTDYERMIEQLEEIHTSATELATYAASLRVALTKLENLAEDPTEAQQSFMWGPH
jgi:hypothetical protein